MTVAVGVPPLPHLSLSLSLSLSTEPRRTVASQGSEMAWKFRNELWLFLFFSFLSFFIQLEILSFINWDDGEIFIHFFAEQQCED